MNRILIVGATSAIAEHYARQEAEAGSMLFLCGRSRERLRAIAQDLVARGAAKADFAVLDVLDFDRHEEAIEAAWRSLEGVDVALLAHGTLPDARACATDATLALREFNTNATATILLMDRLAGRFEKKGHGTLAVISSVAGDRGRASNYLYGSAKAAATAYSSGLRQRFRGTGVHVLTIKPGFVDTPMTAAFRKGALWVEPHRIATGIRRAIGRRRGVVYLPFFWRPIMALIRMIPEPVFRRLDL
ncbi:SDR family oxidoreductase [Luteimonas saliphila]|uniref:SDR family oxidoreductase n=1 Tax=Luteimonas saliphila TaxID=2804919 RepID=UPI00192DD8F2|nr:SDR family oxidoreductase [Luteimonas saliphila]